MKLIVILFSDPLSSTAIRAFGKPVQFIPFQNQFPRFYLKLQHVLPLEDIPQAAEFDDTEPFSITYRFSDLRRAIGVRQKQKRPIDAVEDATSSGSPKRGKKGNQKLIRAGEGGN